MIHSAEKHDELPSVGMRGRLVVVRTDFQDGSSWKLEMDIESARKFAELIFEMSDLIESLYDESTELRCLRCCGRICKR